MAKHLVIGVGEIGTAIQKILKCDGYDPYKGLTEVEDSYDILHICAPYFEAFEAVIQNYEIRFNSNLTIIHGTMPIGTCERLGAVASPCRGVHPNLEEGIRTFVKFFGGKKAPQAAKIFEDLGIRVSIDEDSRTIEALKLWDTTIYGLNIILEKEIYRYCKENNLNFDKIYTESNLTYNSGYEALGKPQFKKYILKHSEGKIGGHCVVPNCNLLDSWVTDLIKEKNNKI